MFKRPPQNGTSGMLLFFGRFCLVNRSSYLLDRHVSELHVSVAYNVVMTAANVVVATLIDLDRDRRGYCALNHVDAGAFDSAQSTNRSAVVTLEWMPFD